MPVLFAERAAAGAPDRAPFRVVGPDTFPRFLARVFLCDAVGHRPVEFWWFRGRRLPAVCDAAPVVRARRGAGMVRLKPWQADLVGRPGCDAAECRRCRTLWVFREPRDV